MQGMNPMQGMDPMMGGQPQPEASEEEMFGNLPPEAQEALLEMIQQIMSGEISPELAQAMAGAQAEGMPQQGPPPQGPPGMPMQGPPMPQQGPPMMGPPGGGQMPMGVGGPPIGMSAGGEVPGRGEETLEELHRQINESKRKLKDREKSIREEATAVGGNPRSFSQAPVGFADGGEVPSDPPRRRLGPWNPPRSLEDVLRENDYFRNPNWSAMDEEDVARYAPQRDPGTTRDVPQYVRKQATGPDSFSQYYDEVLEGLDEPPHGMGGPEWEERKAAIARRRDVEKLREGWRPKGPGDELQIPNKGHPRPSPGMKRGAVRLGPFLDYQPAIEKLVAGRPVPSEVPGWLDSNTPDWGDYDPLALTPSEIEQGKKASSVPPSKSSANVIDLPARPLADDRALPLFNRPAGVIEHPTKKWASIDAQRSEEAIRRYDQQRADWEAWRKEFVPGEGTGPSSDPNPRAGAYPKALPESSSGWSQVPSPSSSQRAGWSDPAYGDNPLQSVRGIGNEGQVLSDPIPYDRAAGNADTFISDTRLPTPERGTITLGDPLTVGEPGPWRDALQGRAGRRSPSGDFAPYVPENVDPNSPWGRYLQADADRILGRVDRTERPLIEGMGSQEIKNIANSGPGPTRHRTDWVQDSPEFARSIAKESDKFLPMQSKMAREVAPYAKGAGRLLGKGLAGLGAVASTIPAYELGRQWESSVMDDGVTDRFGSASKRAGLANAMQRNPEMFAPGAFEAYSSMTDADWGKMAGFGGRDLGVLGKEDPMERGQIYGARGGMPDWLYYPKDKRDLAAAWPKHAGPIPKHLMPDYSRR